jgi:uncharacterized protein (DUF924 family)
LTPRALERADAILRYWFGEAGDLDPARGTSQTFWFDPSPEEDRVLRERFLQDWEAAQRGECAAWSDSSRGRLALILLLDQCSRVLLRGSGRAYAQDGEAQRLVLEGLRVGADRPLGPFHRAFFYLPLMHAEDAALQQRSLRSFAALRDEVPPARREAFSPFVAYAERHLAVIARFGRFPHRNAELDRPSTPEERAFLDAGGRF